MKVLKIGTLLKTLLKANSYNYLSSIITYGYKKMPVNEKTGKSILSDNASLKKQK